MKLEYSYSIPHARLWSLTCDITSAHPETMKSQWVYLIKILYCGGALLKEIGTLLRRKDKLMLSSCLHLGHFIWRKPLVEVILYATIRLQDEQRISTLIGFAGNGCRGVMMCVTTEGLTCWTMKYHSLLLTGKLRIPFEQTKLLHTVWKCGSGRPEEICHHAEWVKFIGRVFFTENSHFFSKTEKEHSIAYSIFW